MPSPTLQAHELTDPHFRAQVARAAADPNLPEIARKWRDRTRAKPLLIGSAERVAIEEGERRTAGVAALAAYCENVLDPMFGRGAAKAKEAA